MKPSQLLACVIRPTLAYMSSKYQGQAAERELLAIALQESGLKYRKQVGGPARGIWRFEHGGVSGVLLHTATSSPCGDYGRQEAAGNNALADRVRELQAEAQGLENTVKPINEKLQADFIRKSDTDA